MLRQTIENEFTLTNVPSTGTGEVRGLSLSWHVNDLHLLVLTIDSTICDVDHQYATVHCGDKKVDLSSSKHDTVTFPYSLEMVVVIRLTHFNGCRRNLNYVASLFNDKATSDMTLVAGDQVLYLHSTLLAAHTNYFHAGHEEIDESLFKAAKEVLRACYIGSLEPCDDWKDAISYYNVACKFEIAWLKDRLAHFCLLNDNIGGFVDRYCKDRPFAELLIKKIQSVMDDNN